MATKAPALTKAQHDAATRRGDAKRKLPMALLDAVLDEKAKAIRLYFRSGVEVAIPIKAISEIAKEPIAALRDVKASPIGDGLIFPELGEALYVPGLLRDLFGQAFAGALGKIGGRSRSLLKVGAARKNGRKGGRPRKVAA